MSDAQPTLDGPPVVKAPTPPDPESAEELIRLLKERFPSDQYAILEQVANSTGFSEKRWADAVGFGLWPSRGLDIIGFEVKVSRSDWQTELKDPEKAETVGRFCEYWWVVVPGVKGDIVRDGELPSAWGLLRRHKGKWVTDKAPPKRTATAPDRTFMAAVMRRAAQQMPTEAVLRAEYMRGREDQNTDSEERTQERIAEAKKRGEELGDAIAAFEKASGIRISGYDAAANAGLGRLVHEVRSRGAPYFEGRLVTLKQMAEGIATEIGRKVSLMEGSSVTCKCTRRGFHNEPLSDCADCHGTGLIPNPSPA